MTQIFSGQFNCLYDFKMGAIWRKPSREPIRGVFKAVDKFYTKV